MKEAVDAASQTGRPHPLLVEEDRLMREVCACSQQLRDMEEAYEKNTTMARNVLLNWQNQLNACRAAISRMIEEEEKRNNEIAQKMEERDRGSR